MSRTRTIPPIPDHIDPDAIDKRKAIGSRRIARRTAVRELAASVGANLPTNALIPSYANQQTADAALAANIARVLGTKKEGEE